MLIWTNGCNLIIQGKEVFVVVVVLLLLFGVFCLVGFFLLLIDFYSFFHMPSEAREVSEFWSTPLSL